MRIFACLIFFFFWISFISPLQAKDPKPITLQLKWKNQFQFAGYYAASIKGFYKAAGLDVKIIPGGLGISPIDEVKSGRADIGIYDADIILHKDGAVPLTALANIMQTSPYVIITLPEKNILKPTDLIGKRVLSAGDQGWNIFKSILYREGIKPDLIEIISRQKDSEEIIEDKGDAVITYGSTQPQRLKAMGYTPIIIKPVEYGVDFYGDVIFSSKKFAYEDTEVTNAFLEATKKGWEYAFAHEDELIDYIFDLPGEKSYSDKSLLKDEAKELRKLIMPEIVEIGHMNLGRWQYMLDIYYEAGIIDKKISLKGFLYEQNNSKILNYLTLIFYSGVLIGVLVIIIAVVNWRLRRLVKQRTAALEAEVEQRKNAELVANNSMQKIELILESANIGLWEWDLITNKKFINENFAKLLANYSIEYDDDYDPFSVVHPDDLEITKNSFKQRLEGKTSNAPSQFRIKGYDGEYFTVLSSSKLTVVNNKPIKISGALVNIEPIIKKEKELIRLSEELMQSNNELKKFAYIVSHNIRGPVVNISSLMDMCDTKILEEGNLLIFDKIQLSIKKLEATLNDLIEVVSHQNTGKQVLVNLNFNQTLNEVLSSIETQLVFSHAKIIKNFKFENIQYSKHYLESILLNLITNAIKYRDPNRQLVIEISTIIVDDYVLLQVKDNGIGIDLQKNGSKLFGLYQRFNIEIEGKGIGLFLIKSHIESLNGKIEVESELGKGTTFNIYFKQFR